MESSGQDLTPPPAHVSDVDGVPDDVGDGLAVPAPAARDEEAPAVQVVGHALGRPRSPLPSWCNRFLRRVSSILVFAGNHLPGWYN